MGSGRAYTLVAAPEPCTPQSPASEPELEVSTGRPLVSEEVSAGGSLPSSQSVRHSVSALVPLRPLSAGESPGALVSADVDSIGIH